MRADGIAPRAAAMSAMARAEATAGKPERGAMLVDEMLRAGMSPDSRTLAALAASGQQRDFTGTLRMVSHNWSGERSPECRRRT